jgi:glycosyltransferase involved in cell wall biosynthesis
VLEARRASDVVSFSVVVPVWNEARDIESAIAAVEASAGPATPCEIVAVDDGSTDGTREILRRYAGQGRIRLVEQPSKLGIAAARNAGMDVASGDVIVFMDADNVVPADFLERLRDHYSQGADFVTVDACVVNLESTVGRFQQAMHERVYGGLKNVGYSQSFSCRRGLATAVRFRESRELIGAEDGEFFMRLPLAESHWARDESIVVGHRMPDTLCDFVRQYAWRGRSATTWRRIMFGTPLWLLTLRKVAVLGYWLAAVLLIAPPVIGGYLLSRHSSRGVRDLTGFVGLWLLYVFARRIGEWRALVFLWTDERAAR